MRRITMGPRTFLFPMPTVLIGAMVEGRPNFMTVAYAGVVNAEPPTVAVGLRPVRHTRKGVQESGVFSLCIPPAGLVAETDFAGIYTGAKTDKAELFQVFYGALEKAPLIEGCPINLECRLVETVELGTHGVFMGEVVESHVQEDCLTDGLPDMGKVDPILYATADRSYWRVGKRLAQAFSVGKKLKN